MIVKPHITVWVPKHVKEQMRRAQEEAERRLRYEQRRREGELRAQWYHFCRGWKLLGLAVSGGLHFVSNSSHDETEAMCEAPYADYDSYVHTIEETTCRDCLRALMKRGTEAFTRMAQLNELGRGNSPEPRRASPS